MSGCNITNPSNASSISEGLKVMRMAMRGRILAMRSEKYARVGNIKWSRAEIALSSMFFILMSLSVIIFLFAQDTLAVVFAVSLVPVGALLGCIATCCFLGLKRKIEISRRVALIDINIFSAIDEGEVYASKNHLELFTFLYAVDRKLLFKDDDWQSLNYLRPGYPPYCAEINHWLENNLGLSREDVESALSVILKSSYPLAPKEYWAANF